MPYWHLHSSGIFSSIANASGKFSWMFEGIDSGPDESKRMESDHECAALDFSILMSWCATPGYKTTNYCPIRAVFNWVSKVIPRLLWFCFTSLSGWPAKHVPPSQPISSKTKTNHALFAPVLPRLASVTSIYFNFWFVHCAFCVCCDWPG